MKNKFNFPYLLLTISLCSVLIYFLFIESGQEYLGYAALFVLIMQRIVYILSRKRR